MKKSWPSVLLLLSLLSIAYVNNRTYTKTLCEGFLPENNLRIPVGDVNALGIDQKTFDTVIDKAVSIYGPVIEAKGKKFVVNRRWDDATVNASAQQQGSNWIINMYGGLARHKLVTADGFAVVVCHELGHHLGGYPKVSGWGNAWATNEGGSDYWATLKCLRKMGAFEGDALDPLAKEACANQYKDAAEQKACETGSMAGYSVSRLLGELGRSAEPKFGTPDPNVVSKTNDAHPAAQCRLDTYFQGALCAKSPSEDTSSTSPNPGACTAANGDTKGLRPLCWYKPPTAAPASAVAAMSSSSDRVMSEKALEKKLEAFKSALLGNGR
jgi:hypothetical protein